MSELYWGSPRPDGKVRFGRTGAPLELANIERYIAVGDSFTDGMIDPRPSGVMRGWADRLAVELSAQRLAAGLPPLQYANLAVSGRLMANITQVQLPQALDLSGHLISIVGGGNDALRPRFSARPLLQQLDTAVARARDTGAEVLLGTYVDCSDSPLLSLLDHRFVALSEGVRAIAERRDVRLLDKWLIPSLKDWRAWAPDHIHLSTRGHKIVTRAALEALGLADDRHEWAARPADAVVRLPWRENVRWLRRDVGPWLRRHLTRRRPGKAPQPSHPRLVPVDPATFLD
ncbi:SGNH/GDSL hydrolase family protein [Buchananella hordeovulneris]|uniref:SGNH/GDSL hydrolase family protein n=1 Tax=Buchananella hordeovulneris TaxID=52770 RepID=UPI000F5D7FE6|nr:SGNH/GDSL hydrolase family protein [Buchananella hordeovulneris]RRD44308.1 SGNH/GDSL hydrolase family protein [Buchananella hordeovulneris]RRD51783.1 SGNH/GDSL hydrolase family protein [Buchananella hordeovulneris]